MEKQAYLTFKEEDYRSFREQLLKEDRLERASFPFLGVREAKEEVELLVHKVLNPADADYQRQSITVVEPSPQFILKSFAEFAKSGVKGYLHAHSHPFQKKPECPICGENGIEGKGDEETKLLEPPRTLNNMNSIPFFPFPLICT